MTRGSTFVLDEGELEERFIRSSGPGGQNVNKVATAVQLRFDVRNSPSLSEEVRDRLVRLAGNKLTKDGILVITAQRFRTQDRNRQDARDRLLTLIQRAQVAPKKRKATRPTKAARVKRRDDKTHQSKLKSLRSRAARDD